MTEKLWKQLNATVTKRTDMSPVLTIVRVEPDGDLFDFTAGQYCVLGLPPDAARAEASGDDPPLNEKERQRMIRRAYSIASSSKAGEYLEFYISLVHSGGLTPRLFALGKGDRVWLGPKPTGLFTLDSVTPTASLFLISTGTGLAPYVSMLRSDLLEQVERPKVVVAHGARYSWDLGYRGELEALARQYPERLCYVPSITRPDEDPDWQGETGYLQEQIKSGRLEARAGVSLTPGNCHVFLCGNPTMIDQTTEMLEGRGFSVWSRKNLEGQIHLEKYWE